MKINLNLIKIKKAALELSQKSEDDKNTFLIHLADSLRNSKKKILAANKKDINHAVINHLTTAFIQRLTLDENGINTIILKIKVMQRLKSGIGEIMEEKIMENGLKLQKVRVSIGVIAVIYEARPEVTIDVATLCIKSGNAAILKGGSEVFQTNIILFHCIVGALQKTHLPKESVSFIDTNNHKVITNLLKRNDVIDLVIARGSYKMVKTIQNTSTIPVLAHSAGGARIYIDQSADVSIVEKIIINSKISKPSACNSLDTIIIHKALVSNLLPSIYQWLKENNIEIIEDNWDTEFLDMKVSIKVVRNIDAAIKFINTYSKKHSEGIIATDKDVINKFKISIDAASLFINCSTRLHDGHIFGLGSEMGIATGKLHTRGPVGLKELTIYKWIAYGNGQVRE